MKIIALQAELEKLKSEREQLISDAEKAIEAAREEGRSEGVSDIKKDYEKAYEALGKGLTEGLSKLNDQLDALDGLALLISRTVLEKFLFRMRITTKSSRA